MLFERWLSSSCGFSLEWKNLLSILADCTAALGEVRGTDCAGGGCEVWLLIWCGGCDCCLEGAVDVVGCLGDGWDGKEGGEEGSY